MYDEIREQLDYTYETIQEALEALDEVVLNKEHDETHVIKNLDNFVERLKLENLYTDVLENFIEDYLKFYNE